MKSHFTEHMQYFNYGLCLLFFLLSSDIKGERINMLHWVSQTREKRSSSSLRNVQVCFVQAIVVLVYLAMFS